MKFSVPAPQGLAGHLIAGGLAAALALGVLGAPAAFLGRNTVGSDAPEQDAGRLMIVGDSITQGHSGDWTWRYRLWQHLRSSGVKVDFVGPRTDLDNIMSATLHDGHNTYADPEFDQDHDAKSGLPLSEAKGKIEQDIRKLRPEYLLVMLGTNDLTWYGIEPAVLEQDLRAFIANARRGKPDIRIILGKVLPSLRADTDLPFAMKVDDFNARLVTVVREQGTQRSPIAMADTGTEFVPAEHTWDGTHSNPRGDFPIAAAFADVLAERFSVGKPFRRPFPMVAAGPDQPPHLTAADAGPGEVKLSWTSSIGATGYFVWVKDPLRSEWTRLPIALGAKDNPWVAKGLIPGAEYRYKFQAIKGGDTGAISNEVSYKPPGEAPSQPSGFTAVAGNGQVALRWQPVKGANGYYVHVKNVSKGEAGFTRALNPVTGTEWVEKGLVNGTIYEFAVQAVNGAIDGGTTSPARVTPKAGGK